MLQGPPQAIGELGYHLPAAANAVRSNTKRLLHFVGVFVQQQVCAFLQRAPSLVLDLWRKILGQHFVFVAVRGAGCTSIAAPSVICNAHTDSLAHCSTRGFMVEHRTGAIMGVYS